MRLSQLLLLACIASQLLVYSAASAPRKLLQGSDVFPWFSGTTDTKPDKSGSGTREAASPALAPSPSNGKKGDGGNSTTAPNEADTPPTCPEISLKLNSIEIYDDVINQPDRNIIVACYSKDGTPFTPVVFPTTSDVVRSFSGARYRPSEPVARIGCGESVSCTVGFSEAGTDDVFNAIAEGGCWFDYRHFTQLSYQEPMSAWTCTKPPVRYTLECVECTSPDFPWEDALALAGPPLSEDESFTENPTLNSVMVIISVSIVAGAVILVVTALLLRGRRHTVEENARMTELILARGRDHANSQRRRRSSFKPPAVFVVGKPIDGPLPPGYTGPIVVVHCGDDEEEEEYYYDQDAADEASGDRVGEIVGADGASGSRSSGGSSSNGSESNYKEREGGGVLRWPQIAIALPEVMETEEPVLEELQITTESEETEVLGSLSSSGELDATLRSEERREPTLQAAEQRPSNP